MCPKGNTSEVFKKSEEIKEHMTICFVLHLLGLALGERSASESSHFSKGQLRDSLLSKEIEKVSSSYYVKKRNEIQALKDFSITNWYEKFKHVALETKILEIPPKLLERLQSGDCNIDIKELCPPGYVEELLHALRDLNGTAFVKNNWHAPKDAKSFSLGNCLKVSTLEDIALYLSVSDTIVQDFSLEVSISFCIALKPWINIHPASEFRCIVVNDILRGISSRDWPAYYPHYLEEGAEIIKTILNFYQQHIAGKFYQKNYVFDVLLLHENEVVLLDFGILNSKTQLYAFKWDEIHSAVKKQNSEHLPPVFRYLENDIGIMSKT